MFNHDSPLIELLKAEDLGVGARIFPDRARQRRKSPTPYLVYNLAGGEVYYHHGGRSGLQNQVVHWFGIADTDFDASTICKNLLTVLESLNGTSIGNTEEQYWIDFVKLADEIDGGDYDPKDGSDSYLFYRRLVTEIVYSEL